MYRAFSIVQLLVSATGCAATEVHAYGGYEDGEVSLSINQVLDVLRKLDSNGDGRASMEDMRAFFNQFREWRAAQDIDKGVFAKIDRDHSNIISPDEFVSWASNSQRWFNNETARTIFAAADSNGDGSLDKKDILSVLVPTANDVVLSAKAAAHLNWKDESNDGKLTITEFFGGKPQSGFTEWYPTRRQKTSFQGLDKDTDHLLDLEEFKPWESKEFQIDAVLKEFFEISDHDEDGQIGTNELSLEDLIGTEMLFHFSEWVKAEELEHFEPTQSPIGTVRSEETVRSEGASSTDQTVQSHAAGSIQRDGKAKDSMAVKLQPRRKDLLVSYEL